MLLQLLELRSSSTPRMKKRTQILKLTATERHTRYVADFKRFLTRLYYEQTGGAPNAEALNAALLAIEARAIFDGAERAVHVRVGGADGKSTSTLVTIPGARWKSIHLAGGSSSARRCVFGALPVAATARARRRRFDIGSPPAAQRVR